MNSGGEKAKVPGTKVLGLVAAALVAIALFITVPLASLASARVEARAGDVVAIAGGDDCDVETTGEDTSGTNGGDEDTTGGDTTQTQDETTGGDQTQQDSGSQQVQNGNGKRVVARAGDAVAIAGGGCDTQTDVTVTEETTTEDTGVGDDNQIEDRSGQPDGDTVDDSDLTTLPPDGSSNDSSSDDSSDNSSGDGVTTQESTTDGEPGTNEILQRPGGESSELQRGRSRSLSLSNNWPLPKKSELNENKGPRRFDPDPDAAMTLSIRALKLYDVPVIDSDTRKGLGRGVIHPPDTAYPWDAADQKNVFIAGHRVGSPEKKSRLVFYHLDELKPGDDITLKDRDGRSYKYRVRELFKVRPDDAWAADTLVGRDLLTLETYTLPDFKDRIVVRADRVEPDSPQQQKSR